MTRKQPLILLVVLMLSSTSFAADTGNVIGGVGGTAALGVAGYLGVKQYRKAMAEGDNADVFGPIKDWWNEKITKPINRAQRNAAKKAGYEETRSRVKEGFKRNRPENRLSEDEEQPRDRVSEQPAEVQTQRKPLVSEQVDQKAADEISDNSGDTSEVPFANRAKALISRTTNGSSSKDNGDALAALQDEPTKRPVLPSSMQKVEEKPGQLEAQVSDSDSGLPNPGDEIVHQDIWGTVTRRELNAGDGESDVIDMLG